MMASGDPAVRIGPSSGARPSAVGPGGAMALSARLDPGNGCRSIRPRGTCEKSVPVVVGVIEARSRAHPARPEARPRIRQGATTPRKGRVLGRGAVGLVGSVVIEVSSVTGRFAPD